MNEIPWHVTEERRQLQRRVDLGMREQATEIIRQPGAFNPKEVRLLEGDASTILPDSHGSKLSPQHLRLKSPCPLLLAHDWFVVLGEVTESVHGLTGVRIKARVRNCDNRIVNEAWEEIKAGNFPALSVGLTTDSGLIQVEEVSVVQRGSNPGALIDVVVEQIRPGFISLLGTVDRDRVYRDMCNTYVKQMRRGVIVEDLRLC